jgi:class 3 adenylate cyclase
MKGLSFGQLRFAILFFVVFFSISGGAQYMFVRRQTEQIVVSHVREDAVAINKAVAYNNGVDIGQLNNAWINSDYIVVLKDGSIQYSSLFKGQVPQGLLPPVTCPVLNDNMFRRPTSVSYRVGSQRPVNWTLYGKRLDRGYWVFGFSDHDTVDNPAERLVVNMALVGATLEAAKATPSEQFDFEISWILVADDGSLLSASGSIPLVTDPMQVGKASEGRPERTLDQQSYYVLYAPITDPTKRQVGVTIMPTETGQMSITLKNLAYFDIGVAVVSFVLLLAMAIVYYRTKEKEKQEIRAAFQHYFSPQILDSILRDPKQLSLGGQRREVTVLFSDIRSFTSITESLAPQQLTRLMQDYFSNMTDAVFATGGIVDKYVGDALLAFWGAPIEQSDQADRAVRAALEMLERLKNLQKTWTENSLPPMDIGIGINLGVATVGNFGSTKRFDYTVIGDVVNAASRLQSLNKENRSHIIISETTRAQLTIPIQTRDLGEVTLKGKEKPLRAFEIL